jgi:hypothetical protein
MAQAPAPAPAPHSWFYGHPAPTISAAAAMKDWRDCITAAAARLDDHKSSVMDVAVAIEPLCMAKEDIMIDATNKEFMDKNPGLAANIGVTQMEQIRQETHASSRQNIGTIILALRSGKPVLSAARSSPATDQEQKDAGSALVACMLANEHDDGISDATTIARPLLSACAKEFKNTMRAFGIERDKLSGADLEKAKKSNLGTATKFVLHQRELVSSAKRCIEQAGRVGSAAAFAHPELVDSLLKKLDDYSNEVLKDPRSCPPFSID